VSHLFQSAPSRRLNRSAINRWRERIVPYIRMRITPASSVQLNTWFQICLIFVLSLPLHISCFYTAKPVLLCSITIFPVLQCGKEFSHFLSCALSCVVIQVSTLLSYIVLTWSRIKPDTDVSQYRIGLRKTAPLLRADLSGLLLQCEDIVPKGLFYHRQDLSTLSLCLHSERDSERETFTSNLVWFQLYNFLFWFISLMTTTLESQIDRFFYGTLDS
jgi:hypothetical protein